MGEDSSDKEANGRKLENVSVNSAEGAPSSASSLAASEGRVGVVMGLNGLLVRPSQLRPRRRLQVLQTTPTFR